MFTELVYGFTETSIGRASLPDRLFTTWFPYLATLFVFIWVSNLISYIPLPSTPSTSGTGSRDSRCTPPRPTCRSRSR